MQCTHTAFALAESQKLRPETEPQVWNLCSHARANIDTYWCIRHKNCSAHITEELYVEIQL